MTRFVDRIVDNIDTLISYANDALFKVNPREMIDLVTTDDDSTFVTKDGALVTIVQLRGTTAKLFDPELLAVIEEISGVIGQDLIKGGNHGLAVSFEFDPDEAYAYAKKTLNGSLHTAKRLGMGNLMSMIIDEKASKMADYCHVENTYLALSTYPTALHKDDMKQQVRERAEAMQSWPDTAEALLGDLAFPALRTRHQTMVSSFMSRMEALDTLDSVGLLMKVLSVKDYLKDAKRLTDFGASPNWEPRTMADALTRIRVPSSPKEMKANKFDYVMPPTFGQQLFGSTVETIGLKYAVMGNRLYYSCAVTEGPRDPETFDRMIHQAADLKLPFRITMSMKGDGIGVNALDNGLASLFPWMSSANSQRKDAVKNLQRYEKEANGVIPAMYITACTWAPAHPRYSKKNGVEYDLKEINERATKLNRVIQSWGGMQTRDTFNAPIEGSLSTQAGLFDHPLGCVMAPTMPDAIGMTPIFRPTTSWTERDGNVMMRTQDGKFLHYQQTSKRQNAWVTLLVGPMGYAKSTTINTLNFYYLLTPSTESEIPYLRCMDIGPSSRSIVDAVKQSVSVERQNVARYIRLENSSEYQLNPNDTAFGLETPLPNHKDFLVNLVSTLCYGMSGDATIKNQLPGLVSTIVDKTFAAYASKENGGDRPRQYYPNANALVDQKIHEHGIQIDDLTSWHELRDALFDAGEVRAALICHRKAMPILSDMIAIASLDEIRKEYPDEHNGTLLLDMFARSIREAVSMFPILQGETKFELGESRVISLDLEDLVPKTNSDQALWQASIAFFIGYNLLTSDFFFHRSYLKYVPKRYSRYHTRRVQHLETSRKRFSMDERQRFSKVPAAQSQVDSLILEGRKNLVDIMVASQMFDHHTEDSIDLATSTIILGTGNMTPENEKKVKTRFSLTDSQMKKIRSIRKPTKRGAEVFAIFKTDDGTQAHYGFLTDGPIYLWLIATEAVDRSIRMKMYERFNETEALKRLAKRFPGGSIKSEVDARLAELNDDVIDEDAIQANLVDEFIEECSALNIG
jgi:intracellular multiplication protein IcmB